MSTPARTAPQVIVGVDRSLSGLAAIRAAVAEAVRRGVPLHAARVGTFTAAAGTDLAELDTAFREALGGFPPGVQVCRETMMPPVAEALTDRACHPGDLLFLGTPSRGPRHLWHRIWSPHVLRQCLHKARCTVIVVRAPEMCDDPRSRRRVPRLASAWIESGKGDHGGPARRQTRA